MKDKTIDYKKFIRVDDMGSIVRAHNIFYASYTFSKIIHSSIDNIEDVQIQWNIQTQKKKHPTKSGEYLAIEKVPIGEMSDIYRLSVKIYIANKDKKKSGWRNISTNQIYIVGLDTPIHYLEPCNEDILAWTKNIFPISPAIENEKEFYHE